MAAPGEGRVYAGRTAEERRLDRRRRLLDAGLELFASRGYAATSVERVCATAGVTTRNFYEEFTGREALLAALFDETSTLALAAVQEALDAAPEDPFARIEAACRALVGSIWADPRRAQVEYVQVPGVSPAMEGRRRRVWGELIALTAREMDAATRRGALPARDHRWTAVAAVGAANQMLHEWIRGAGEGDRVPDVFTDEVVRLFSVIVRG